MSEEQKEKWYKAFTREQLIERCEYLQRSCERKEEQITDLDDENFDLENEIEKQEAIIKEVREKIESVQMLGLRSGKTLISTLLNDILEILDKASNKTKEVMPVEELEEYEPKNMAELEYQDWFWD